MTANDIHDAIETFARYGVPRERIFNEVMRARYLDYVLFLNPENVQYGISIDDLYENMKRTADKLGMYEGDADTYARVYTLALRVEPLVFAQEMPTAPAKVHALLAEAVKKAEAAGNTVLFTGAEEYLPYLAGIFQDLGGKRIAIAVKDAIWKERLHYVFPRGRAMLESELAEDTEHYDYIFDFETDGIAAAADLRQRLAEKGVMDVIIPSALLTKEGDAALAARRSLAAERKLTAFYDTEIGGNEYAYLRFAGEAAKTVSFGLADFADGAFRGVDQLSLPPETFIEADDWNYDLYAFNGSPSVQMLLSQNIVSPDFTLGKVFSDVPMEEIETDLLQISREAVTDSGVRMDLAAYVHGETPAVLRVLAAGDLVLTTVEGHLRTAVVKEPCVTSDEGILDFRPVAGYTAEYAKLYFDGKLGELFLATMKAGEHWYLTTSRLLRLPIPQAEKETIEAITRLCDDRTKALATAEAAWREAKEEGVKMMVGK